MFKFQVLALPSIITFIAGLFLAATSVSAQVVIYDNFGPGDTFSSGGLVVTGENAGVTQSRITMGFSNATDCNLDSITLGLWSVRGPQFVDLQITTDPNGSAGTILESWLAAAVPDSSTKGSNPITLSSSLHPTLEAGQTYYLVANANGAAFDVWSFNSTGASGLVGLSTGGAPFDFYTQQNSAFRVTGAVIPEPATYGFLVGVTALGFVILRRRLFR